jgi:hypothetical protein
MQRCPVIITLMTEAASTSETMVNFYHTTRYNNPEDSHLQNIFYLLRAVCATLQMLIPLVCDMISKWFVQMLFSEE